jgi:hypothetical protein
VWLECHKACDVHYLGRFVGSANLHLATQVHESCIQPSDVFFHSLSLGVRADGYTEGLRPDDNKFSIHKGTRLPSESSAAAEFIDVSLVYS